MSIASNKQHEEFEVNSKKLKVIRQDRIDLTEHNCRIKTDDNQELKITNISAFGALVCSPENELDNKFNADVYIDDIHICKTKFKIVRVNTNNESTLALETVDNPIEIDKLVAIIESKKMINNHKSYQERYSNLPENFIRKVYEIKDWLENLQAELNKLESEKLGDDKEYNEEFEKACSSTVGGYLAEVMPLKNEDLQVYLKDINEDQIKDCYDFFRDKLHKLIYQSPFSNRVFYKPLGYAGDYEMMNIIYKDDPSGKSLFAKCLHEYWVKQPAAQAVRNRAGYIAEKIKTVISEQPNANILSVACGPAKEWQNIISEEKHNTVQAHIELLDQDEGALKHANRKIKQLSLSHKHNFEFQYSHKAIKNIIGRGLEGKYDLIYSAGLFDYFSDPVVEVAGAKLFNALKPGGKLILGNFNVDNPNSIAMDLALDWHLIYRTEQDLVRLFKHTGGKIHVEKEPLNINLFCVITKE